MNGAEAPTHARYWVVVYGILLAVVQYIDRICISQAAPNIQQELELDKFQMSWVFGAFTLAYAIFEIPTGWLGDKFGPRKTLMRVVLWWSFFTAATGWVKNLFLLVIVRFLFGAGEAGCFPNLTKVFTTWLRPEEKVRAQAILWLSARWGGALTPFLVASVLTYISWRYAFGLFGLLGIIWAVFFYLWFRDDPRTHPGVNEAERSLLTGVENLESSHASVPWGRFCTSRTTWLIWLQYFCLSYPWYFYITFLPTFQKEQYGGNVDPTLLSLLAGIPLFFGGFGNLVSGYLGTRLARKSGNLIFVRRVIACTGFAGACLCLFLASRLIDYPVLIMLAMGMASFCGDLVMPCAWGACMDVGGKFAGTFSGSMNMMGNLGGFVGPIVLVHIYEWAGKEWAPSFAVSSGVYLLGAICWLFIDPVSPLDRETAESPR